MKQTQKTNSSFIQTDIGPIPEDWEVIDFESTITDNDFSKINHINSSEIKTEGKYPVVDQGQDYISGYTDSSEKVYHIKEPIILFGDHTRIFKYIDFPFVGGADGIKIFSPNKTLFSSKFFYYVLSHLNIPSRGYNRHYKLLKEKKIINPPLHEQRKIAFILSKIQQAIEKQEQIINTTQELKKALMQKLFTEGLPAYGGQDNEPQKQTEIGLIPKSWEVVSINEILSEELKNGAFIKSPKYGEGHLFVNVVDIYENAILNTSILPRINISISEIEKYLLQKNDIVFVRSSLKRDGIGESCLILCCDESLFFDCHLIRIRPNIDKIDPLYLVYFWRSPNGKKELIKRSKTTTMTTINQQNLSNALFPYPSLTEQKEIVKILSSLDSKIGFHNNKKTQLQDLFKTMLNQLMTGQLRVKDINLKVPPTEGI